MTNESPENTLYSYIEISSREISTANEKNIIITQRAT